MAAGSHHHELDAVLHAIAQAVRERTGLAIVAGRGSASNLKRAMAQAGAPDAREYATLLAGDSREFDALVAELTIGETYFLREKAQLEFVASEILPEISRGAADRRLKAWSAGCATGEEAYSLAIIAEESRLGGRLEVVGTDVARNRLEAARRGVYGKWSLRGVPDVVIDRHFERNGSLYSVTPALRSAVSFRYLNLRQTDWSAYGVHSSSMDLILCRNVLIYLDEATIARVAAGLIDTLGPRGWLLLGASDPPLADLVPCEVVVTGAGLAYRRSRRSKYRVMPREAVTFVAPPAAGAPALAAVRAPSSSHVPVAPAAAATREVKEGRNEKSIEDAMDLYRNRKYEEACAIARDLVAVEPGLLDAWVVLVRGFANVGRLAEAGLACASGMDIHRTSAELAYMHAILLRAGSQLNEAAAALRRALYLDPQMAVAHLAMGDLLSAQGAQREALRAYQNAERALAAHAPDAIVAASDGHSASYLRGAASLKRTLLAGSGTSNAR